MGAQGEDLWEAQRRAAKQHALQAGFGEEDAKLIVALARPGARLVTGAAGEVASGASKLGGLPDLPADCEWPRGHWGPMAFYGQVNTGDVAFLHGIDGWQPGHGLLSFFVDQDPESDEAEAGRVIFLADGPVERRTAPPDLPGQSRLDERPLEAKPLLSPPMAELLDADLDYDLDSGWEPWERLFVAIGAGEPTITAAHHQLLGNAWQVGMEDPVRAGSVTFASGEEGDDDEVHERYRLLAQFTSDEDANIEIADAGAIYFVTTVEDLAAGRYERTALYMDFC